DRSGGPGARAGVSRAADEAALSGRLPGALSPLWNEPEFGIVRVHDGLGGSAARTAPRDREEERRCLIQNDAIRRPAAASAGRTTHCQRCPPASARSATKPKRRIG